MSNREDSVAEVACTKLWLVADAKYQCVVFLTANVTPVGSPRRSTSNRPKFGIERPSTTMPLPGTITQALDSS